MGGNVGELREPGLKVDLLSGGPRFIWHHKMFEQNKPFSRTVSIFWRVINKATLHGHIGRESDIHVLTITRQERRADEHELFPLSMHHCILQ